MKLDDLECEVLIKKFVSSGYDSRRINERLQMIDPYISLETLKLTLSPNYLS